MSSSQKQSTSQNPQQRQRRALQQAQQVLESLEQQDTSLEGFNLLGVVANPRGFHHYHHHERSHSRGGGVSGSSQHGSRGSQHSTTSSTVQQADSSFYFTDSTMQALELTLSQMTEQIDVFTDTLDSWSRQYLGSYDESSDLEYTPPDTVESLEHSHLPEEITSLSLDSVQAHLEECGKMAHRFTTAQSRQQQQQQQESALEDDGESTNVEDSIAPLFFQSYFDLTDPATFCQLLVLDDDNKDEHENTETEEGVASIPAGDNDTHVVVDNQDLVVPTEQILQLPPPDFFTPCLDRVEVALLNQVRLKSSQFFHETNRFGLLQEWIRELVEECQRIRSLTTVVEQNSVKAWELIPQVDQKRRDLLMIESVLDQANNVVRCKASIGGLLSAGQDLSAAEQIQYGRALLQSDDLAHLQALSTVGPQLTQYETLVVANLGDELIEVLLDWNNLGSLEKKQRVPELVRGLELCQALPATATLYGNRLNDVIRMTVRTTVGEFAESQDATVKAGVTSMTLERFMDCLDMLFEQLTSMLKAAVGVYEFCCQEGILLDSEEAVTSAAELSTKSISELLRLRKDVHSLVSLEEMRRLWDVCMSFTTDFENLTDYKATGLRSTLLAQAKAFVERKHESNMSALVAALESERWTQCDVSAERQEALTRLCMGRSVLYTSRTRLGIDDVINGGEASTTAKKKMADAEVEGVRYKVVWSCLLLVEMVMTDMACAAHFKALATNMVGKVAELLRLFNSRATQLVLGAGAIHSAARLKSINAKHLSLVTQCVGLVIAILPHVRAALMAQLPTKQHTLLNDLDTIKKEYEEHNEKILNKFVTIIGGIVEHGLAPRIGNTNFDERAREELLPGAEITCCVFLEGVSTNTRKMHQVLSSLLPPDHLQDSFSRIFAYLDQKLPELFMAAAVGKPPEKPPVFSFPSTDEGKKRMLLEVEMTTKRLNELSGVRPWEFTAMSVLEQELDYKLRDHIIDESSVPQNDSLTNAHPSEENTNEHAPVTTGDAENDSTPNAVEATPLPTSSEDTEGTSFSGEDAAGNENGGADGLSHTTVNNNGNAAKTPVDDSTPVVSQDPGSAMEKDAGRVEAENEGMNGEVS